MPPVRDRPAQLRLARRCRERPDRPVFVGCDPAFDTFRIVCARLDDRSPDQPANVAVVHISHMRERVTLGNRLREVESSRGVAGLPLVILSVTGQLRLEESAMIGRRAVLLPSTVTIHWLMEAFNELTANASSDARQVA